MPKTFKQLVRELFTPDSVDVNLGAIKLKYTDELRGDVALVLADLRSKRVLFASIEQELWMHVFESLKSVREQLAQLSGKVQVRGPGDVRGAVDFMLDVVSAYLAEHEAAYTRFMQGPNPHRLAPAHLERNWPALGDAAADLISLRRLIHAAMDNLNQYASKGEVLDWEPPASSAAAYWVGYARQRKLCPACGWNMIYAYDDECPVCPSSKTEFRLKVPGWPNSIAVAGSFNGWQPLPMNFDARRHSWVHRLALAPGEYEYKFVVDGQWLMDPQNPMSSTDASGHTNSVMRVT
jgi:hypothetical protein